MTSLRWAAIPRVMVLAAALVGLPLAAAEPELPPWTGPDGEPLPFASSEEVEEFLATAEVISSKPLRTGITGPRKLLLERDGVRAHAVFKDVDDVRHGMTRLRGLVIVDPRDCHRFDCAAYQLDRLLGLGRVPPSVPREIAGRSGTVTLWLEGTITDKDRRDRRLEPPDPIRWEQQRRIMYVFDNLVGNLDGNLGNILIDRSWKVWLIDHTRSFTTNRGLIEPRLLNRCDRTLFVALEQLDEGMTRDRLGPFLTDPEIDAVLARRHAIVALLRDEIDRIGENAVLFDLRPPTPELADW